MPEGRFRSPRAEGADEPIEGSGEVVGEDVKGFMDCRTGVQDAM